MILKRQIIKKAGIHMRRFIFICMIGGFFISNALVTRITAQQTAKVKSDDLKETTELGVVHWNRNLAVARTESKKSDKPVLLLFQEVPG